MAVLGCSWRVRLDLRSDPQLAGAAAPAAVTFAKDVAPILYKNCAECHRPSMFAPMSLMTYDETRPWARAIKQRVVKREMPPWSADPAHGVFKNDPRLSQKDIDTIAAWVDAGAPQGQRPRPAGRADVRRGLDDRQARRGVHDDRRVQGAGRRHGPVSVLHDSHQPDRRQVDPGDRDQAGQSRASSTTSSRRRSRRAATRATSGRRAGRRLGGTTPNKPGVTYEPGVARLLRAGSEIMLQMHYTTNGGRSHGSHEHRVDLREGAAEEAASAAAA